MELLNILHMKAYMKNKPTGEINALIQHKYVNVNSSAVSVYILCTMLVLSNTDILH